MFMKDSVNVLAIPYLLALRFSLGAIAIFAVCYKRFLHLTKADVVHGIMIGVLLFGAYFVQTIGISDTTPGKNAFLTATYCVIVPFLVWVIDRKKPDKYEFLAAFLCIAGIGFVSLTEAFTIRYGDLMTILCGFLYAAHILAIQHWGSDMDPIVSTTFQLATVGAISWLITLQNPATIVPLQADMIGTILFLGLGASALCMFFQTYGLQHVNPVTGSILLSLESVFGALFSILFYKERVTIPVVIGFGLIFTAVILAQTKDGLWKKEK